MKGLKVCRIFGIDVEIHWTWIFIFTALLWAMAGGFLPDEVPGQAVILYWIFGVLTVLLFFISLLLHELAHSLVAMKFGIPVRRITLFAFGGVAQTGTNIRGAKEEVWIALAGPLSSLIIAGLFWAIAGGADAVFPSLALSGLAWLAIMNVYLAAFNILPIFPMDGGRVFRAAWWWKINDPLEATRIALFAAKITALAVVLGFIFLGAYYLAFMTALVVIFFLLPAGKTEYLALLYRTYNG